MAPHERSPLLPKSSSSNGASTRAYSSTHGSCTDLESGDNDDQRDGRPFTSSTTVEYTEDDIAIEGMVITLISELEDRGYTVPPGLVDLPTDMRPDEIDAEQAVFRTVFQVPRLRNVLNEYLPNKRTHATAADGAGPKQAADGGAETPRQRLSKGASSTSSSLSLQTQSQHHGDQHPHKPSPLSSQIEKDEVISSPSALLLSGLLSLLISLQAAPPSLVQETDKGVDGELRMYKARRDLGERLYAVVGGLLDSYLLSGDQRADEDDEDALVTLLFHDFPLNYDSTDRATCALDLILKLSSYPLVEAENLVSHPVVLASTEYVWRNGLLPKPKRGVDTSLSWTDSFVRLDRFSTPRILHMQTYILSTVHAAITVYILMFSSYAHFDALNPLAPDAPRPPSIPERPGRPPKTWSVWTALVWWLWIAGVFGWAGEVMRAWYHRGPVPSLPLSPSTLLPLIHHALVFASVVLRLSLLSFSRKPGFILASSLSALAWSIPFLAASRVLPQNLPAFGAPTHQRWEKIRDGRKRRELGYRPPPKSVPVSHRALRSLEAHLGGLVQFGSYFAVFGILLLWSLSGELDYPSLWLSPLVVREQILEHFSTTVTVTKGKQTVSPLEARTTLAFTLVLGVVLAYFAGGRPSVSPKNKIPAHKELDDLDGWDRYGREVAFRARRERLAINRYYSYIPPTSQNRNLESVPSAFGTPPVPSPFNLLVPPISLAAFVLKQIGMEQTARKAQEGARLWVWRIAISPLGLWGGLAKVLRTIRRKE
ncbi:hypothetical protein OIO90_003083 [Microbotryomycetes sp. JL221]|nr:hypothetical protein OIO90_003083 [Microbotryomycetes sp. JL221]